MKNANSPGAIMGKVQTQKPRGLMEVKEEQATQKFITAGQLHKGN